MVTEKRNILMIFVLLALLSFPYSVYALNISPAVDGFIRNGSILFTNLIQVLDAPGQSERGIVEFPLDSACTPIKRATLRLHVFNSSGSYPFNINVYSYAGDGSLTAADYSAGTLTTNFAFNGTETVDVDVTDSVLTLINDHSNYAGFNLRFEPPSGIGPYVAFNSRQYPPEAILILECNTPVPTMTEWGMIIFMVLAGLGAVYYMMRQKRATS